MSSFVEIPQPSRFRVGELFTDNNFIVPVYQRNYAWGVNEVEDFWDDLEEIVNGRRNSHFFGQIVTYKNDNNNQEIIDGQQRLTTSTIFMAVIRDIANQLYSDNFGNGQASEEAELGDSLRDIRRQVTKSIRGKGEQPSLTVQQNTINDEENLQTFFFNLTNHAGNAIDEKTNSEPKNNMQNAYQEMNRWINASLKQEKTLGGRIDHLQRIFDSFFEKFYIVMISAPSRQDAFTIFETLNSRGKDLKASDIIKNHLLSLMGNELDEGNKLWNKITSQLDNNSDRITRFIRTYWAAKKRVVSEAKLYREVSTEINNANDAQQFLDNLNKVVALYTVLESPMSPKSHSTFFESAAIMRRLDILNRLRVLLYYPIILSMFERGYSESDILKVVNKILSIFIRHRTILNNGTNKLESGFSDIASKIWNLELQGTDGIIREMNQKLLPSDEATKAAMNVLAKSGGQRGAKKWTLVYLLAELFNTEYDDFDQNDLYLKVFDDDNYRLVQISTDNDLGEYQNFLGNWTILEKNLPTVNSNNLAINLSKSNLKANQAIVDRLNNG